jgi:high-affinity Fe2+/Pb2+ permease
MDTELLKQILIVGIGASIFSTATIQKLKENSKTKKYLFLSGFVISMVIGILFSRTFTELDWISCIWVGLSCWLGADLIYKTFEDKIFKSFKNIEDVKEIERDDVNGEI